MQFCQWEKVLNLQTFRSNHFTTKYNLLGNAFTSKMFPSLFQVCLAVIWTIVVLSQLCLLCLKYWLLNLKCPQKLGLLFPDKKRIAFRNLVQVPQNWSFFKCESYLVPVPQVCRFFILLEFCARVVNSAKFKYHILY